MVTTCTCQFLTFQFIHRVQWRTLNLRKKSLKIVNSKFKKSKSFVMSTQKKIQENFGKIQKVICGRSIVLKVLAPLWSPVNMVDTKTKKNPKNLKRHFIFKNSKKKKKKDWGFCSGKPQLKFERNLLNRF